MQLTLDNVQIMDVTDAANNVNDAETNEMLDVVNSFVHVHNIEKFRIIVNTNSVYFIFQTTRVLTDDERFVIFGDMELLEMYA
ncbi:MAG: hypothetical protein IJH63_13180 [Methanobrevibacter sp.]|nr:hypothetical protein [Methanobrevibacter sp.]